MHRRGLAGLPLLLVLAACSSGDVAGSITRDDDGAATRSVSQPIVNGTPDTTANDSVVYIAIGNQGSFCTGTLIAPNLVLTAHHCVADPDESQECGAFGAPMAPSSFSIFYGLQHDIRVAGATKVIIDTSKANNICGNDISLIQLDRDIPNAKLSKVRLSALTAGETATTAGYGDDGSGSVTKGRYLKIGIKVDAVGPTSYSYKTLTGQAIPVDLPAGEIVSGESTCFGDSGGPLFDAAGNVIGMTSRGIDEKCIDRPSIFTDTASHAATINAAAVAAGHPLPAAAPLPGQTTTPGTTPQSDPASTADEDSADEDTTADEEPVTPTKKKKKATSLGATSGGCSAAAAPVSASSLPLAALVLGAVVVAGRRARRRTTPPPASSRR